MKTYLTIDFDIIMAPTIETYNALASSEVNGWALIVEKNPLLGLSYPSIEIFNKIIDYFKFLHDQGFSGQDIHIIENHHEIVPLIKEEINLINVDHHHDIAYSDDDALNIKDLNCGNWVKFLKDNDLIHSYYWINDSNSRGPWVGNCEKIINKQISIETTSLINLLKYDSIDKVIICFSAPWIPERYRGLFDVLMKYIKALFNMEEFNIECQNS